MKLTIFILVISLVQVSAATFGQSVTLKQNNVSIAKLFYEIRKQTGYDILVKDNDFRSEKRINANFANAPLSEVIDQIVAQTNFTYTIGNKIVVISEKKEENEFRLAEIKRKITGRVINEKGEPIVDVTVRATGGNKSIQTKTDVKGWYSLLLEDGILSLSFSFVGFTTQNIKLSEDRVQEIDVRMIEDLQGLDQVQITAYGTTSKRIGTGSITHVTAKEIEESPATSLAEVLKDRVPGLLITQKTGAAGGAFDISVRGVNNLSTNKAPTPLFIVDGVTYPSGTLPLTADTYGLSGAQQQGNYLNYINKNDIESIDILKDADATAIYGSRGAYGVIIITTKKAKEGEARFNVNYNHGLIQRATTPELLNTEQYLTLRREALANDKLQVSAQDLDLNGTWPQDRYSNWVKELTGDFASTDRLSATYSAGSGGTNFVIGTSYDNQGNIQRGKGDYRDLGFRFNINNTSSDSRFKIDFGGQFNSNINDQIPYDLSGSGGFTAAPNAPPFFNSDGTLNWEITNNPAAAINRTYKSVINNLLARTSLSYRPLKNLDIRLTMGYNIVNGDENTAAPSTAYQPGTDANVNVYSIYNSFNTKTWTADPFAVYTTKAGLQGLVTLSGGATIQNSSFTRNSLRGNSFASDALLNNPANGATVSPYYYKSQKNYIGFFGIANYNWGNKYIVNLSGRRDASTKFGPANRWGTFGSVAGSWNFSEEGFFKKHVGFISFGKIRASYGFLGGDAVDDYLYLPTYTILRDKYQGGFAVSSTNIENANLHWDKSRKFDLGFLLEALKGRILFDGSYYRNVTLDQLLADPLPSTTGYTSYANNVPVKIENKGFELSLGGVPIQSDKFRWKITLQVTIPKSKLLSLPDQGSILNLNYVEGKPVTGILLFKYAGVNAETGRYNFVNAAGEQADYATFVKRLDQIKDRTEFVDLSPQYYGDIRNEFKYKSFNLSFIFNIRNRVGKNFLGSQTFLPGYYNVNSSTAALRRWQKPGDITDIPAATTNILTNILSQTNFLNSTGAYEKFTYARLQNLNLSYNFSPLLLKKIGLTNLNMFLQGENLLTISKYKGLDPENTSSSSLPPLRYYTFGFNLTL